ncbi:MAG: response regulator transcription factor [Bacteroidetes bacterium]|nr:response regulator transcription factor [Bacteroidota bacterium]
MSVSENTILLVDDEQYTLEFLSYNLSKQGYEVYTTSNGKDAIVQAKKLIPSIIVLDILMPEMDGIETCIEMRKISALNNSAIAFLTCRGEDYSQIVGFEAGADAYIKKPIRLSLLIERLKALEKRMKRAQHESHLSNDLIIDKNRFLVKYREREIDLTIKEFELLNMLASKPGAIFSREELSNRVWGTDYHGSDRTINVHISRIRKKINHNIIETIKGVGYKFGGK